MIRIINSINILIQPQQLIKKNEETKKLNAV